MPRRSPAILLLGVVLLVLAPSSLAAEPVDLSLAVPDELVMDPALLLIGAIELSGSPLWDPGLVDVQRMELPDGTLFVCPAEGGRRGEVPPFPVLEDRCRGEEAHEDPSLVFGARTWIATGGNHTVEQGPDAAMVGLHGGPRSGSLGLAMVLGGSSVEVGLDEGRLAFRPMIGTSEVIVQTPGQTQQYNSTDWIFFFQADGQGTVEIAGGGLFAGVDGTLDVSLAPAGAKALDPALQPRVLLDIQDAVRGADLREPTRNATRLLDAHGRIPHLVDGGLLGHLNGTIGDQPVDGEALRLVRIDGFTATASSDDLEGSGRVLFQRAEGGIVAGVGDPVAVPWWLVGLAYLGAAAAIYLRGPPERAPGRARAVAWASVGLVAVLWDLRLGSLVGTSALEAMGSAGLGVVMALAGFELIALGLAAALLLAPIGVIAGRVVPERWSDWAWTGAVGVWGLYVLVWPGTLVAMGQLVARL